jgi:hypothetical protein
VAVRLSPNRSFLADSTRLRNNSFVLRKSLNPLINFSMERAPAPVYFIVSSESSDTGSGAGTGTALVRP